MKKDEKQRIRKLTHQELLNEANHWHRVIMSREAQARGFTGDPLIPVLVKRKGYTKESHPDIRTAKKTFAFIQQELHLRTIQK